MSNERIIPIILEDDADNRNESSTGNRERNIAITLETSSSTNFNNGVISDFTPSMASVTNRDPSPDITNDNNIDVNSDMFHNNKNIRSYSQVLSNKGEHNKSRRYNDDTTQCSKRLCDENNCCDKKLCSDEEKTINKPPYRIKPLSEVIKEQNKFFDKYSNFKGRFKIQEEVEAAFAQKAVTEKVIFIIDCGKDEDSTPFIYMNNPVSALNSVQKIINKYQILKQKMNKMNEFAVILLQTETALSYLDFNNDIQFNQDVINQVSECTVEDIFDFNKLFDILHEKVAGNEEDLNCLTHAVLFYNRSYTLPVYDSDKYTELLNHPNFVLDIVMTHEPADVNNRVEEILEIFNGMTIPDGNHMVIPVGRDSYRLRCAYHKVLGNPHQRPWQIRR